MPNAFTETIINQNATSKGAYSSAQFHEQLGNADDLAIQVIVDAITAGAPITITALLEHSYLGTEGSFSTVSGTSVTVASLSTPTDFWLGTPTQPRGPFGRVKVTVGTSNVGLRVIACGRTKTIG